MDYRLLGTDNRNHSKKGVLPIMHKTTLTHAHTMIPASWNQAHSLHPTSIFTNNLLGYQIYALTAGVIGLFPSIASFFLRQLAQRKGPSQGLDPGEKNGPELTDKPSPGSWSTWQIAHLKSPEFDSRGKSLPSLHVISWSLRWILVYRKHQELGVFLFHC